MTAACATHIGTFCGDNKISFFGIDDDLSINIYKTYTPPNIQCVMNAIQWHPENDQLLYAGTNGVFSLNSELNTDQNKQDFRFENQPISTNVTSVTTNNQWFGYCIKNIMNVVSWNTLKLVSTKKNSNHFNSISFIANRYIIGGDVLGNLLIHNCNSHLLSTSFNDYVSQSCVNCIDVTKNRINWFTACNDNGFNYLFDITREKIIYYDYTHSSPSNQCAFNPVYSSLFVSCGLDKKILVHDINRKKVGINFEAKSPLSCVQYLPHSDKYIICCSTNGEIYLYDLRRYSNPLKEMKTSNCILALDLHSKLKYSSIKNQIILQQQQQQIKEIQEMKIESEIEKMNTKTYNKKSAESPISSAVAGLPAYMNKKFGDIQIDNVDIKQQLNFADVNGNNEKNEKNKIDKNINDDDKGSKIENSLDERIRKIVRDEIKFSESRVLAEFGKMMSQLHSDLIEQFITNEISCEKNLEQLFKLMLEFKNKNETLQNELKYAKF